MTLPLVYVHRIRSVVVPARCFNTVPQRNAVVVSGM